MDSRKKRVPVTGELVTLRVIPSLPTKPLKLVQPPKLRFVFCCNVQPVQMAGQATITFCPERCRVSRGRKLPALVRTVRVPAFQSPLTRSSRPSPLTSATASDSGPPPTLDVAYEPKLPRPLLVRVTSVLLPWLTLIKSGQPSPLTSAAATAKALAPPG